MLSDTVCTSVTTHRCTATRNMCRGKLWAKLQATTIGAWHQLLMSTIELHIHLKMFCSLAFVTGKVAVSKKYDSPLPELIYFFVSDVPKQDLGLVDVVTRWYDGGQRIALLQEAVCQVQRLG